MDAVPEILATCPNVNFIIVGADSNTAAGNSSVLADLKSRLEQASATAAVSFVSHVALTEMPSYYRAADICVVPSLYENAPYTVLEALATDKPVIGSNAGGTPEYIADGETGLVVPAKDSKALAQAIISLVNDEGKRKAMGRKARERALELYEKRVIAEQAVASYELAINKYNTSLSSALYKKSAEQSLFDFVQLLYSYEQNLNDYLYIKSRSYKLRYWQQCFVRQPDLFFAKLKAIIISKLPKALASKNTQSLLAQTRAYIVESDKNREKETVKSLLKACQLKSIECLKPGASTNKQPRALQQDLT